MKEIQKIAVPIDLLANSDKIVTYGVYLAKHFTASLHLIHVVAPFPADAMLGAPYGLEYQNTHISAANQLMDDFISQFSSKVKEISGEVITGDPTDKIIEFTQQNSIDLILVGTHGAKGLEKIMLGSVAGRVLKRANCPVLIINPYKQEF